MSFIFYLFCFPDYKLIFGIFSGVSQSSPEQPHPVQQQMHAQPIPVGHTGPPGQQFPPQNQYQPPRFGPPQGMQGPPQGMQGPPQGMQGPPGVRPMAPNNELWVEIRIEETGKIYYYHAITRQTTWSRPTGPNVQIMTQSEIDNMQKQQAQKREMPPGMGPPFGMPPFFNGPPPFGMPPPNFSQPAVNMTT